MTELPEALKIFTSLFAILNPFGALPFFLSITQNSKKPERQKIAFKTSLTVFTILLASLFAGEKILYFFGISLPAFKAAGGFLLLLMSVSMLQASQPAAKHTEAEGEEALHKESIAITPLGIPLISGPGAISTVILYGSIASSKTDYLTLSIIIFICAVGVFLILRSSSLILKALGQIGINIITRIMGLVMAAVAIEFIASGLIQIYKNHF